MADRKAVQELKSSEKYNKIRQDLLDQGYEACQKCHP